MRIGLVSPYSLDVPGGVQLHVLDLAEYLIERGDEVSVLAPAEEETALPPYAVSAGSAVPVRYNGSVARLAFGPAVSARVQRWVEEGNFDVIHVHEPASPSVSMLAVWAARGPVIGTFHTATVKSRAMRAAEPILRPTLERLSARIAVSEAARQTVAAHLGDDALVIPNGIFVQRFRPDASRMRPMRSVGTGPTVVFLGRFDEPRKGLSVLVHAAQEILDQHPDTTFVVAGPGEIADAAKSLPATVAPHFRFLGAVSDDQKVTLLASADVYVAPNTGGESFGIILIEAMAAGAPVLASDLTAFDAVLDGGRAGRMFPVGDSAALAAHACALLADAGERNRLSHAGLARAWTFDWSRVGERIVAVYESMRSSASPSVVVEPPARLWSRWRRR